ncbi:MULTISPECIES: thiamine pyrophosphate-dependent enzyme [Rhodococcus]|uniref:thiamine pyrophosphate-dependent enzyme n=1 Tax=Rhodococcus TaxID=1827 RepID=UPI00097768E4|nr:MULTISPECIES: thiamine pyrophosphate-dependent enzyme [Rhodococcus]OMQ25281.1 hypothetical protein BK799_30835 [Rhodococcus sp. D-1]
MSNRDDFTGSDLHRMTGACALEFTLASLGVEVVFEGWSSGIIESKDESLRYVGTGQGRSAGHAAVGYAQATGKVGVCIARSASEATDLITPLVDAQRDSVPLVALTIQKGRGDRTQDRVLDISGMTMPIAKHSIMLTVIDDLPRVLAESFHIASTGRPGVAVIDMSENLLQQLATFSWPPTKDLPGYRPRRAPHHKQIRAAAVSVLSAHSPILYVGGGVVSSGAAANLQQWVDLTGIPVITTTMARGAFPDSHRLHYGMPGVQGAHAANQGLHRSDLVIALGASFDSYAIGFAEFSPGARIIHADIDPSEIGRSQVSDISIVGDCAYTISALTEQFMALRAEYPMPDLTPWIDYLDRMRASSRQPFDVRTDELLSAGNVVGELARLTRSNTVYVSETGPYRALAANQAIYERPRTWLNSGNPNSHGYALSAAIGAQIGASDSEVWALVDDQSFLSSSHSLATAVAESLPIKVALLSGGTGTVEMLARPDQKISPDFLRIARGWGCRTFQCESVADVEDAVRAARDVNDRPAVIDFLLTCDIPSPLRTRQNVDSSKSIPKVRIFR